ITDPEEAIPLLGKDYQWSEAIRICQLQNRRDLIETHIKPSISEGIRNFYAFCVPKAVKFFDQATNML
ncbi:282_t:CDS:2, partial [Paraglomus brasilianum]